MKLRFHRYEYPVDTLFGVHFTPSPSMLQSFDEETHEWKPIELVTEKVYVGR